VWRTIHGTNTGPGGSGKAVLISGYEEWRLGTGGPIPSYGVDPEPKAVRQ